MALVLQQRTDGHSVRKKENGTAHRKTISCRYKVAGHDHTSIEDSRGSSMTAIRAFF